MERRPNLVRNLRRRRALFSPGVYMPRDKGMGRGKSTLYVHGFFRREGRWRAWASSRDHGVLTPTLDTLRRAYWRMHPFDEKAWNNAFDVGDNG